MLQVTAACACIPRFQTRQNLEAYANSWVQLLLSPRSNREATWNGTSLSQRPGMRPWHEFPGVTVSTVYGRSCCLLPTHDGKSARLNDSTEIFLIKRYDF